MRGRQVLMAEHSERRLVFQMRNHQRRKPHQLRLAVHELADVRPQIHPQVHLRERLEHLIARCDLSSVPRLESHVYLGENGFLTIK